VAALARDLKSAGQKVDAIKFFDDLADALKRERNINVSPSTAKRRYYSVLHDFADARHQRDRLTTLFGVADNDPYVAAIAHMNPVIYNTIQQYFPEEYERLGTDYAPDKLGSSHKSEES
jgi:hypothetical protein